MLGVQKDAMQGELWVEVFDCIADPGEVLEPFCEHE